VEADGLLEKKVRKADICQNGEVENSSISPFDLVSKLPKTTPTIVRSDRSLF
jgi:hypothetical protein